MAQTLGVALGTEVTRGLLARPKDAVLAGMRWCHPLARSTPVAGLVPSGRYMERKKRAQSSCYSLCILPPATTPSPEAVPAAICASPLRLARSECGQPEN